MRLLLVLLLLLLLLPPPCSGLDPPAPRNLRMSSENFKHVLHWTPAEDAAPGLIYHVHHSCLWCRSKSRRRGQLLTSSTEPWAVVPLRQPENTYSLCVQSQQNQSYSRCSSTLHFTPYLDTIITAPHVTLSGGDRCIHMNISLPEVDESSGIKNLRDHFNFSFNVSLQRKDQDVVFMKIIQQTLLVSNLVPGEKYCVKVQPQYLEMHFKPSPWKCVSTNPAPSVFKGVVSGAVVLVCCLMVLSLVLWGLSYIGIICKLKQALPLPLMMVLKHHSSVMRDPDPREPVSPVCLLPQLESRQHQSWSHRQDEQEEEEEEEEEKEDQEQDLYMDRGADLSADSSLTCGQMRNCNRSVHYQSGSPTAGTDQEEEEEEEEEEEVPQARVWADPVEPVDPVDPVDSVDPVDPVDPVDLVDWGSELEQDCVDLFSVTVSALDDEPPSFCTSGQTLLPQPDSDSDSDLDSDTAPPQAEWNNYMDRQI